MRCRVPSGAISRTNRNPVIRREAVFWQGNPGKSGRWSGGEWCWLREGSIPLRFQGGVSAPINKSPRSLAAQTGWLVNSKKNEVRYADVYKEATRPFTGF